jgi:hypothetical protein
MYTKDNRSMKQRIKDSVQDSFKLAYALTFFAAHPNRSLEQK